MEKFPPEVTAVDANVVVDGNAVTGTGPATSMEFALALVEQLYGKEKVEQIAKPMVRFLLCYFIFCACLLEVALFFLPC